jgi:hypothetical protein
MNGSASLSTRVLSTVFALGLALFQPSIAAAAPFFFSTGDPDGKIATASRPENGPKFEIESADDFVVTDSTRLTGATFRGLLTGSSPSVNEIVVEIYRVFPKDSDVNRTSGPPVFSTPLVPTRVNSPSDVALLTRDSATLGDLKFTQILLGSFTASNSVQPGGIHPKPGQTTGGNGAVTGQEVEFDVTFLNPIDLPADHYFFIPQVDVSDGEFLWLSAPRPIVPPGTPFPLGFTDLQSWTRDAFLDPDWLRVGGDIVGVGTFNAVFSLTGEIPAPATLTLLSLGLAGLGALRRWGRRRTE